MKKKNHFLSVIYFVLSWKIARCWRIHFITVKCVYRGERWIIYRYLIAQQQYIYDCKFRHDSASYTSNRTTRRVYTSIVACRKRSFIHRSYIKKHRKKKKTSDGTENKITMALLRAIPNWLFCAFQDPKRERTFPVRQGIDSDATVAGCRRGG